VEHAGSCRIAGQGGNFSELSVTCHDLAPLARMMARRSV
jgi:hypothetical protein